jgi:hypothetical protein
MKDLTVKPDSIVSSLTSRAAFDVGVETTKARYALSLIRLRTIRQKRAVAAMKFCYLICKGSFQSSERFERKAAYCFKA